MRWNHREHHGASGPTHKVLRLHAHSHGDAIEDEMPAVRT
jgi:hypothetical protein